MKRHRVLLTALLLTGFAGLARADVLFSNLAQASSGLASFDALDFRLATDFLTDGTPSTITSLTAILGNSSGSQDHTATFGIHAPLATWPGVRRRPASRPMTPRAGLLAAATAFGEKL